MATAVYIIHMPPANMGLDQCSHGAQVGSTAVYDFISMNQPRLSLHGHIHESPECSGNWFAEIGKTVCIQPGQLEPFTYVLIDVKHMTLERYLV